MVCLAQKPAANAQMPVTGQADEADERQRHVRRGGAEPQLVDRPQHGRGDDGRAAAGAPTVAAFTLDSIGRGAAAGTEWELGHPLGNV